MTSRLRWLLVAGFVGWLALTVSIVTGHGPVRPDGHSAAFDHGYDDAAFQVRGEPPATSVGIFFYVIVGDGSAEDDCTSLYDILHGSDPMWPLPRTVTGGSEVRDYEDGWVTHCEQSPEPPPSQWPQGQVRLPRSLATNSRTAGATSRAKAES